MKKIYFWPRLTAAVAVYTLGALTNLLAQRPVQITNAAPAGSAPSEFATYNGRLYFSAQSSGDGAEIYSTDGTPAGVSLVKNINTGPGLGSDPNEFTVYNDKLYFSATTSSGREFWVSDGTSSGTVLVRDIFPGASSGDPKELTVANGKLYFVAQNGPQRELWVSDGTTAGTQPLATALGVPTGGSTPTELTVAGDKLFYRFVGRNELWSTNGTAPFTNRVRGGPFNPLNPEGPPFFISLSSFTTLNTKLIFRANSPGTEDEPWVSDGTPEGTFSLDITSGPNASFPRVVADAPAYNDQIYFIATQRVGMSAATGLWATDGTVAGTQLVKPSVSIAVNFEILGSKLYFFSGDNEQDDKLWVTDGTEAGTQLVRDLSPGAESIRPGNLTAIGDRLYFTAGGGVYGKDLWASDGTPAGTQRLYDYNYNAEVSLRSADAVTAFNNQAFFTAKASFSLTANRELWRLDNINLPPVAPAIANATGTVGVPFFQAIPSFTDPEGVPLSYSVSGLPANLSFSGGSGGIIAGTPAIAGVFTVTVIVTDRSGNTTSVPFTLTINPGVGGVVALQLLAPTYNCLTGLINLNTMGGNGTPIVFIVPGVQRSNASATIGTVEDGLRNDPKPILIQAIQSGSMTSYMFDLAGFCSSPPSGGVLQLLAPTYNCATGAITLRTSGGDGSPITYLVPGVQRASATSNTGIVEDGLRNDPKPILIQATQSGSTITYTFNLAGACGSARQAAGEPTIPLSVRVMGNPVLGETAEIEVSGAEGQALTLLISDSQGRAISAEQIEQATPAEIRTIRLGQSVGLYLLRVSTPAKSLTLKLLRQ